MVKKLDIYFSAVKLNTTVKYTRVKGAIGKNFSSKQTVMKLRRCYVMSKMSVYCFIDVSITEVRMLTS